jgi:hypothetical protein
MDALRRDLRSLHEELIRSRRRRLGAGLGLLLAGVGWLLLGSGRSEARAPVDRPCTLETWEEIAGDLEGEVDPRALLGLRRDPELEEELVRRGVTLAAFAAAARQAVAEAASASVDDATWSPLMELIPLVPTPPGVEVPFHPEPLAGPEETPAMHLAARLLQASRAAPRGVER